MLFLGQLLLLVDGDAHLPLCIPEHWPVRRWASAPTNNALLCRCTIYSRGPLTTTQGFEIPSRLALVPFPALAMHPASTDASYSVYNTAVRTSSSSPPPKTLLAIAELHHVPSCTPTTIPRPTFAFTTNGQHSDPTAQHYYGHQCCRRTEAPQVASFMRRLLSRQSQV